MLRRLLPLTLLSLFCSPVSADGLPLRIDESAERMRVDGALNEWKGARFVELGSGDDTSMRYALAEADKGLYVAAEVRDERLITGDNGDALVLALVMPDADTWVATDITLQPGEAGKARARALVQAGASKPRVEPIIQVVEGPRKTGAGYVLEAFVPWSLIRGAQIWEQGRGALRLVDVDDSKGGAPTVLRSATGSGTALPLLAMGAGNRDLLGSFLQARQLNGAIVRYDFRADVSGDAQPERVLIVDSYVVVYGPGYKAGETYSYFSLPYSVGGGLLNALLMDLTGDGKRELVVTVRQQNALGTREVFYVLTLDDEGMGQLLGVETRKQLKGGVVDATVVLQPASRTEKLPRVEVKAGQAQGLDANTWREQPAQDAEPILLPWGEVTARSYAWDGKKLSVIAEQRQKTAPKPTTPVSNAARALASDVTPSAPPASEAPSTADLLALFKAEQKLPRDAKSTRTLRGNVLSGPAAEQVDVFGSVLVLTGPDVGAGQGYLTYGAPITDARDLLDLKLADVTADRGDELLLRLRQPLGGSDGVERELLLVLRDDGAGKLVRIASIEVLRRQRERSIENKVVLQSGALVVEPGVARGWSQQTYPFTPDGLGGAERLLLPWSDHPTRYHRQGAALVPVR